MSAQNDKQQQPGIYLGETSHRERSGLTTTRGCLFGFVCGKKKPRS
jgi:hypothetical protein